MGKPKALVDDWLASSVDALREGGCDAVTVVLGAAADEARVLVPADVDVVVATDWVDGMGASLRAGLAVLDASPDEAARTEAALVHLVDLPDVGADVVRRLLAAAAPIGPMTLARATYGGVPGHPVLLGHRHWPGVIASASGDRGARDYLRTHEVTGVECGALATGRDVDGPLDDQP